MTRDTLLSKSHLVSLAVSSAASFRGRLIWPTGLYSAGAGITGTISNEPRRFEDLRSFSPVFHSPTRLVNDTWEVSLWERSRSRPHGKALIYKKKRLKFCQVNSLRLRSQCNQSLLVSSMSRLWLWHCELGLRGRGEVKMPVIWEGICHFLALVEMQWGLG